MEELDIGGDDEDAEDYYEDDDEYQDVAEDEEYDAYIASTTTPEGPPSSGTFFCFPAVTEVSDESDEVYSIRDVYMNQSEDPVFMVIDTGCQRLVGGCQYLDAHEEYVQSRHGLKHVREPERQFYRFGKGDPECSLVCRWLPIGLGGIPLLLRCSSVSTQVPLLGSRLFMSQSGAVIDSFKSQIFFHCFNVTRDLFLSQNGHLCVRIDEFPKSGFPRKADRWARDARHEFAGQGLVPLRSVVPRSLVVKECALSQEESSRFASARDLALASDLGHAAEGVSGNQSSGTQQMASHDAAHYLHRAEARGSA